MERVKEEGTELARAFAEPQEKAASKYMMRSIQIIERPHQDGWEAKAEAKSTIAPTSRAASQMDSRSPGRRWSENKPPVREEFVGCGTSKSVPKTVPGRSPQGKSPRISSIFDGGGGGN
jgi:hypothetical protein